MKKALFILSGLCLFGVFSVQAKNVFVDDASFQTAAVAKLGAVSDESFKPSKDYDAPEKEIVDDSVPCEDPNCIKCDTKTGTCLECAEGRYLQNNLCFVCPENHYCDGKDAIPNCQGVTCADGYTPQANENGCCCVKDENTGGDNNNPPEENACGTGQIEMNGVCCEIVSATEGGYGPCPAGTTRISNGGCAKCPNSDPCANVTCPSGQYCSNGVCIEPAPSCKYLVYNNKCYDCVYGHPYNGDTYCRSAAWDLGQLSQCSREKRRCNSSNTCECGP